MARELQGDLTGAVTLGVGDELADDQLGDVGVGEGADLAGNDLAHGPPDHAGDVETDDPLQRRVDADVTRLGVEDTHPDRGLADDDGEQRGVVHRLHRAVHRHPGILSGGSRRRRDLQYGSTAGGRRGR
jgi:hypothetical protein